MKTLAIQSVFYNLSGTTVIQFVQCLTSLWIPDGWRVEIRTGDCGNPTAFPPDTQAKLQSAGFTWTHLEFGENLGFGEGQNRLFALGPSDRIWLLNPDALFARDTLTRLMSFADERPGWGIVEPRLSPLEHPKAVDFDTYETGWCSGCAPLIDARLFAQVGGFDKGFFLYSEDVDLSWRIKALDGTLYCCPWASVYHARTGIPSDSERLWNQVSELLLLCKYGRLGHLKCRIADLWAMDNAWCRRVVTEVVSRLALLGKTTAKDRTSASWSGRLNSPLRWQTGITDVACLSFSDSVSVQGDHQDDLVESAVGAWAAGVGAISVSNAQERLPFDVSKAEGSAVLEAGQVPFPGGLPGIFWMTSNTVECGRGWLATGLEQCEGPASGVQRAQTEGKSAPFTDGDDWRFWVRQARAMWRLRSLPPDLAQQVRKIFSPNHCI